MLCDFFLVSVGSDEKPAVIKTVFPHRGNVSHWFFFFFKFSEVWLWYILMRISLDILFGVGLEFWLSRFLYFDKCGNLQLFLWKLSALPSVSSPGMPVTWMLDILNSLADLWHFVNCFFSSVYSCCYLISVVFVLQVTYSFLCPFILLFSTELFI